MGKSSNVGGSVPDRVPDYRLQLVLNLITQNNNVLLQELSKQLMVSKRTIRRDIEKLKTQNKLKREGNEETGYWVVIENTNFTD